MCINYRPSNSTGPHQKHQRHGSGYDCKDLLLDLHGIQQSSCVLLMDVAGSNFLRCAKVQLYRLKIGIGILLEIICNAAAYLRNDLLFYFSASGQRTTDPSDVSLQLNRIAFHQKSPSSLII